MSGLSAHRICNADHGRVACYCSALDWMTLDQYGEHIDAIVTRETVLAYGHGFSAGRESMDEEIARVVKEGKRWIDTLAATIARVGALAERWDEKNYPGMIGISTAIRAALNGDER